MKTYKRFLVFLFSLLISSGVWAQQKISGTVSGPYHNDPVKGAIVTVQGESGSATTDSLGQFSLNVSSLKGMLSIWAPGYYDVTIPVVNQKPMSIVMVPEDKFRYNQASTIPLLGDAAKAKSSLVQNINKKDIQPGALYVEDLLNNNITGLQVINKSGMPGEGALLKLRGIRSLVGNNAPLIVINGVPYLQDMNQSAVIGGYSQSVFDAININDIENVTFLKGAEASLYGSLGSNGVILIETTKATDFETKIEFTGQYGVASHVKNLPLLGVSDFKSYISDIGLTKYEDMGDMLNEFPFLKDDPNYYYKFLYNNNTDWQSQIYNSAFVTDNNLRVKGGDAIAKYDLSVGYLSQEGVLKNTYMDRYNTRLNANITLSKKIELTPSISFAYMTGNLHEQGMINETNPLLTAYFQAPILNPYRKDEYNHQLPSYDIVRQFNVSNPLAAVNTIQMTLDAYDLTFNTGINYKINNNFKINGLFGMFYNYNRQSAFIPGKSSRSIVFLEDDVAQNTERASIGQNLGFYYNVNAGYEKTFGENTLSTGIGIQSLITELEMDAGKGRNTSSDFYKTLSYVETDGRAFWGYINKWNWMSMYAYVNYDFRKQLFASVIVSADGSSSTGANTNRYGFFPSGKLTWKLKNTGLLQNSSLINQLDLHAEYGLTGNSRYPSNLSKNYYSSIVYRNMSGIVKGAFPNTSLSWENTATMDFGAEISILKNRLTATADYYKSLSKDVIMAKPISSVLGVDHVYDNGAEISNEGIELGVQASLIDSRNFHVILGGTLNLNKNKLEKLGSENEQIFTLDDGSSIISRVGEPVYSFYGYVSDGVFSTQADADAANLSDYKGQRFNAGDLKFRDLDGNHIINDADRTIIGNANPDYFGNFFGSIRFKNLTLSADFIYSVGNKAYNAVRRSLESSSTFYNQSTAVIRRWQTEGQITDMPKATYNDPMQNSRFSSRWIEDASYLRLNNVTLSYDLKRKVLGFVRGGTFFVSGENLFTFSDYLGLDPVNAVSYDPMMQGFDYAKLALPRTVKFGFKMQF